MSGLNEMWPQAETWGGDGGARAPPSITVDDTLTLSSKAETDVGAVLARSEERVWKSPTPPGGWLR